MLVEPCEGGTCINTDGSFRCSCGPGFKLDSYGRRCQDVDECGQPGVSGNGTCSNTRGGFQCECASGFQPGSAGGPGVRTKIILRLFKVKGRNTNLIS